MSSTPGLVSDDELPVQKGLNPSQPSFGKNLIASDGFAAPNGEHISKKRTCSDMQNGDIGMEGGKRIRVNMDAINTDDENANILVEAEPAQK
jgi:hypothetical protein